MLQGCKHTQKSLHNPLAPILANESRQEGTGEAQLTLDGALEKQSKAKIYIHNGATHAVAQFVMCNDQVYVMAVQHVNAQIGWPSSCSC